MSKRISIKLPRRLKVDFGNHIEYLVTTTCHLQISVDKSSDGKEKQPRVHISFVMPDLNSILSSAEIDSLEKK